jgi:hypothetical protein
MGSRRETIISEKGVVGRERTGVAVICQAEVGLL